jgi:hypothetical protein
MAPCPMRRSEKALAAHESDVVESPDEEAWGVRATDP